MTIVWCTAPGWRKAHAVPAQVGRIVDAPALCSIKPDDGWRLARDGAARCGTCLFKAGARRPATEESAALEKYYSGCFDEVAYYPAEEIDKIMDWLATWREDLVTSLAIMDGGKSVPGSKVALFEDEHDRLRHNILSVADSIEEQLSVFEGLGLERGEEHENH